jgi:SAM-dependent methyltransferase
VTPATPEDPPEGGEDTSQTWYADRLAAREGAWWKRVLDVQRPYRWNLRRQHLGRTLDVGCGLGRNLKELPAGSVGVDHNAAAVAECRRRGLTAFTVDEWEARVDVEQFDSILLAHVLEHVPDPVALLASYLPALRAGGTVFIVCPQERGYASDPTHVAFLDGPALQRVAGACGLAAGTWFSFPLPRWAGRAFIYNEFCLRASKPLGH